MAAGQFVCTVSTVADTAGLAIFARLTGGGRIQRLVDAKPTISRYVTSTSFTTCNPLATARTISCACCF